MKYIFKNKKSIIIGLLFCLLVMIVLFLYFKKDKNIETVSNPNVLVDKVEKSEHVDKKLTTDSLNIISLCLSEKEETLLSAKILDKDKYISFCEKDNKMIYRFGSINKVELEYSGDFEINFYERGGGPRNSAMSFSQISFINNEFEYTFDDSWAYVDEREESLQKNLSMYAYKNKELISNIILDRSKYFNNYYDGIRNKKNDCGNKCLVNIKNKED